MKLIIQIPCYNEEKTLEATVAGLPKQVSGFDVVETLVIDDGSTDETASVAVQLGVDHVVRHIKNLGLARAFMTGLQESLVLGADVIVNTDGDNQYDASAVEELVRPVLDGRADLVIGARPIDRIVDFSRAKRRLQRIGSWVVRVVSQTKVGDATSGFRAMSREAAIQMFVFNDYTYTLETIIQAGQKNMAVMSIPVSVNPVTRRSRLVRSIPIYVLRSVMTIVRIFII